MSVAIIVIVLVVAIPVLVSMSGAIAAAILGWLLKSEIEERVRGHRVRRHGRLTTPLGPLGPLISHRYHGDMDMLIRNLPDDVHAALVRRAEARDMSLRAYVVEVLSEHVGRPTMQQWIERVRALPPVKSELTGADWVRLGREEDGRDDRD